MTGMAARKVQIKLSPNDWLRLECAAMEQKKIGSAYAADIIRRFLDRYDEHKAKSSAVSFSSVENQNGGTE